jgi:hypothetical protein
MNPLRQQWDRIDVGVDRSPEMMLNSDVCLYYRAGNEKALSVEGDTKLREVGGLRCECAWTRYSTQALERHAGAFASNGYQLCGVAQLFPNKIQVDGSSDIEVLNFTKQRVQCCGMQHRPAVKEADGT